MARGNPVGEFNTRGQGKCPHCGNYFPENWVTGHIATCSSRPVEGPEPEPETRE